MSLETIFKEMVFGKKPVPAMEKGIPGMQEEQLTNTPKVAVHNVSMGGIPQAPQVSKDPKDPVAQAMASIHEEEKHGNEIPKGSAMSMPSLHADNTKQVPVPSVSSKTLETPPMPPQGATESSSNEPSSGIGDAPPIDPSRPSTVGTMFAQKKEPMTAPDTIPSSVKDTTSMPNPENGKKSSIDALREKYAAPPADNSKDTHDQISEPSGTTAPQPLQEMLKKAEAKTKEGNETNPVPIRSDIPLVTAVEQEPSQPPQPLISLDTTPNEVPSDAIHDVMADLRNIRNTSDTIPEEDTPSTAVGLGKTQPEMPIVSVASTEVVPPIKAETEIASKQAEEAGGAVEKSIVLEENTARNGIEIGEKEDDIVAKDGEPIEKENTSKVEKEAPSVNEHHDDSLQELKAFHQKISEIVNEEGDAHLRRAIEHLLNETELRIALHQISANTNASPKTSIENTEQVDTPHPETNVQDEEGERPTADILSQAIRKVAENTEKKFGVVREQVGKVPNAQEEVERLMAA